MAGNIRVLFDLKDAIPQCHWQSADNLDGFLQPSSLAPIPTFRVMNSDGIIKDPSHTPDVTDEQVLTWYRNMVTGA
jgi:hypothetical protein